MGHGQIIMYINYEPRNKGQNILYKRGDIRSSLVPFNSSKESGLEIVPTVHCRISKIIMELYSASSLESPLSIRATISLFPSAKNPNFNAVFAYWYFTIGGICTAPMRMDHQNKP